MDEMKRTLLPKKNSWRKALEGAVIAQNKYLREVVGTMSTILLLRNAHPDLSAFYALQFYQNGLLSKPEAAEFAKFPPSFNNYEKRS